MYEGNPPVTRSTIVCSLFLIALCRSRSLDCRLNGAIRIDDQLKFAVDELSFRLGVAKMTIRIASILLASMLFANNAAADAITLSGKDTAKPPVFSVTGPWTMDWSARSEFPLLASIEIRLHDGETGEFIGDVAEIKGTGSGLKLFEDEGSFQVAVVGTFVEWDITVQEIDEAQAASLKRSATQGPTMVESARQASRLVPEGSFQSWRPEGNQRLLLFNDDGIGWRVSFSAVCPGLDSATGLSFVMAADDGDLGQYDSILLDDGTRCHFSEVLPNLVQR